MKERCGGGRMLFNLSDGLKTGGVKQLYKRYVLRKKNKDWRNLLRSEHALLADGAGGFKLKNYYIHIADQVKQLEANGFKDVRIFAHSGAEITNDANRDKNMDIWIYYLCKPATAQ